MDSSFLIVIVTLIDDYSRDDEQSGDNSRSVWTRDLVDDLLWVGSISSSFRS